MPFHSYVREVVDDGSVLGGVDHVGSRRCLLRKHLIYPRSKDVLLLTKLVP